MVALPGRFGSRHILLKDLGGGRGGGRLARTFLAYGGGRLLALRSLSTDDDGVEPARAVAEAARRFADEVRLAPRLRHPNLVFVVEAGVGDPAAGDQGPSGRSGAPYVVTEYVAGKTLRQVLGRCAEWQLAFPVGVALLVVREILRALAYLHGLDDQGFVHRDVHPGSVLLSYEGEVKLADIGMARWRERLHATGTSVTWDPSPYAAPEVLERGSVDARADVYAAGGILWELLTGRPWPPEQRTRGVVPPPSSIVPVLPSALDALVLTAVARDPDQRFASAAIFAAQIATLLPATHDAARLQAWLGELFEDDRERERLEEERLLAAARRLELVHAADDLGAARSERASSPRRPIESSAGTLLGSMRLEPPPPPRPPTGEKSAGVQAPTPRRLAAGTWLGIGVGAAAGLAAGVLAFAPKVAGPDLDRAQRPDAGPIARSTHR
jgi:serine/threonine protein kinase